MSRRLRFLVCAVAAVASAAFGVAGSAAGAVVVVNSTGDGAWDGTPGVCETAPGNGVCTLRAAFAVANTTAGTVIDFAISGSGVHSIAPGSLLPALTQPVTVDGTSQPGYAGVPLIELSGASAPDVAGIVLTGGDSTVRGLVVDRWGEQGILIESNNNTIAGNYLGVAPDGQSPAGNGRAGNDGEGVLIFGASGNTVGGSAAADRNVISANGGDGVQIQRTTPSSPTPATGNVVEGNYVGTNATGDGAVANGADGISLVWGAQGNTVGGTAPGTGNVISGNSRAGVTAFDTSSGNLIEGNYIGTNASGTAGIGGQPECGVLVSGSDTVGGTSAGARNVMSGNSGCGVVMGGSGSNIVEGNYIGTNAAGTAAVGNGSVQYQAGVSILSSNNQLGGTAAGAGNLISGNIGSGVSVYGANAPGDPTNNAIAGNLIGPDATGTADVGNTADGVAIYDASGNSIGGTSAGARNVISANGANGISIDDGPGPNTQGNTIQGNYIGVDAAGTHRLGNGTLGPGSGISVEGQHNLVGGTSSGAGNVISGELTGNGVVIGGFPQNTDGNTLAGNLIGTDATGARAIGNQLSGVSISSSNNIVGGTTAGAANTIAHNGSNGVEISGGTGDPIEGNSIFANSGLGIALTSGGNGNEPAPTVVSALSSGSSTTISGTAATGRRVEVFANASCSDPEGAVFLGSPNSSSGSWSLTVPAVSIGSGITATATSLASNNTSQFSTCQTNRRVPPVITSTTQTTFSYTGVEQRYAVPAGVRGLSITATGARGGGPVGCCLGAGRGAVVSGIVEVTPGELLYVEVGGPGGQPVGGFNGGGDSVIRHGISVYGGGGASDVRTVAMSAGATSLNSRLIVAAGGGGSGYPAAAGGDAGAAGGSAPNSSVGGGAATETAGGAGGCDALRVGCGMDGSLGIGGTGGSSGDGAQTREGAGGGGGLYGGGGGGGVSDGAVGGGGGGSSLVPPGLGTLSLASFTTPPTVVIAPADRLTTVRRQAHRDGTFIVTAKVPGPGRVDVLITAWKDNFVSAARLVNPAPGRFVFARAHATATRANTLRIVVKPNALGQRLVAHHRYRVTLRLWISYTPSHGLQRDIGYYGLRLP